MGEETQRAYETVLADIIQRRRTLQDEYHLALAAYHRASSEERAARQRACREADGRLVGLDETIGYLNRILTEVADGPRD